MSLRWSWIPFALLLIILPFPGTVAARLLLLLICGSIALHTWWRRPAERMRLPFLGWLIPWLAISLVSLSYAVDPAYTLRELQNEFGYTAIILLSLFIAAARTEARHFLLRSLTFGTFLIAGCAAIAWIAHDFVWDEASLVGGSGTLATYVVTVWPVFLWSRDAANSRVEKRLAEIAIALSFFLALITLQRIVLPVIAFQLGLAFWVMVLRGRLSVPRRGAISILMALIAIATASLFAVQHWRYQNAKDQDRTTLRADIRLAFWPTVITNILDHPVSGAGFGRNAMRKAYPELVPIENPQVWHAHNLILNQGISSGLPGIFSVLLAFLGVGAYYWRAARNSQNQMAAIAGLLIVVGVLLRNQLNDFFVRDMSMLYWALIGLTARACLPACKEAN